MKSNKLNVILENAALRLEFNREAGGLVAITSKLTGETYAVINDVFAVETTAFRKKQPDLRQVEWATTAEAVRARYADADLTVEVVYELLRTCPTLAEKFTADITATRKELADSLAMVQDTPECFLRWRKSDEKLMAW